MPRVKRFSDAVRKYAIKYDNNRLMDDKIKAIASENREFSAEIRSLADKVAKNVLIREGVPKDEWKVYKKFAREIVKASLSYSSTTLFITIEAKKTSYVSIYNADPSILDKIVEDLIGQTPPF